ncbi:hypothetical protein [Macrococcoides caseolyticum]|uniref:hypothetical protein n=1 Tax=Macrococcoides caseolyticum TaxID=69966 RepID=UPI001F41C1BD|nr:hypothetical protein [Macrococcus caseolyticus]MCE4957655.1 hypothetical protein [Macrococcus caseolyticus]
MIDKWWARDEWMAFLVMIIYLGLKDILPAMWTEYIVIIMLVIVLFIFAVLNTLSLRRIIPKITRHNLKYFISFKIDVLIIWLMPLLIKLTIIYFIYSVLILPFNSLWDYIMVFGGILFAIIVFDEYFERCSDLREVVSNQLHH